MAPEESASLSWRSRARLLTVDLFAFDIRRLNWGLAARAMVGLMLPLLLSLALGVPELVWVGVAALVLAMGDFIDDGDRQQSLRLVLGTVLGSIAIATGVLAGGSLAFAVAGMLFWGALTATLCAFGSGFAAMSLPIAWAYVELGLPAKDHSLHNALLLGILFASGGLLILTLTSLIRIGRPFAMVKGRVGACYDVLADYSYGGTAKGPVTPQTTVRSAIAEARRVAAEVRSGEQEAGSVYRRAVILIEIADRLFSLMTALRETGGAAPPLFGPVVAAIADALRGAKNIDEMRRLTVQLDDPAVSMPPFASLDRHFLQYRVLRELSHALHVVLGDESLSLGRVASPISTSLPSIVLSAFRDVFDWRSEVARHALRFAVATAAAVVVLWVFPKPFGYWVPLTVTVVLKASAGMTQLRTLQRCTGTVAGILLGMALMPLLPTQGLQLSCVLIAFFFMMAVLPVNYGLAIFFLSAGLIPYEHFLYPEIQQDLGLLRLLATGIGAALALISVHLFWPTYEKRGLPHLLDDASAALAAHADAVLASAEGISVADGADRVEETRRRTGHAITTLQNSLQRSMTEVGGKPDTLSGAIRASSALQGLFNNLTSLMQAAPVLARRPRALAPFRTVFVEILSAPRVPGQTDWAELLHAIVGAPAGAGDEAFVNRVLEQMAFQLETLRDALATDEPSADVSTKHRVLGNE